MTDSLHAGLEQLALDDAPRIDKVCDEFEAAWRAGERPAIEDYTGPEADALLCELVCVDVEYRRSAGDNPSVAEYRARFPSLETDWLEQLLTAPVAATATSAANRLGRFELLGKVGHGACGVVWRAFDPRLSRVVALKVPHPGMVGSPEAVERFRREAQTAANLRHPGIVAVYDVVTIDGSPVLVQDFLDGESLKEKIATERLNPREAAAITADIAEALSYAHSQGAVHRDIKPANIVVTGDCRAVIVDFGLALQDGGTLSLTADGQVLGTPAYMSPEQAAGRAHLVDARSDIYSLGVVLYETLTGHPPFQEQQAAPLLRRVIEDDPRPPRAWDREIPLDIETVCLKAMAKEPQRRYATAGEFAADLRRFLDGDAVYARPPGTVEKTVRWVRRYPTRAALAAVSMLAVAALVGASVAWAYNTKLDAAYKDVQNARRDETAQHRQTENAYYFQRLALASREWSMGNVGRVEQILAECPKPLRGWEWNYLNGLTHREVRTIKHYDEVDKSRQLADVAYSPDGSRLATAGWDGRIRIWNTAGGNLGDYQIFPWGAQTIAWHPDGRRFATADVFGRVVLVDASTGKIERTFKTEGSCTTYRVAFRPDGQHLAAGGGDGPWETADKNRRPGEVRIWEVETGHEVLKLDKFAQAVTGLAWHPDGHRLAVGEGALHMQGALGQPGVLSVWDTDHGTRLWEGAAHEGPLTAVSYSPDGKRLATAGWDRAVIIWDAETGKPGNAIIRHRDWVRAVAFAPDGVNIASAGSDAVLVVWNADTGRTVRRIRGHTQAIAGISFHPTSGLIATCSADKTVKIWDPQVDQEARVLKGAGPVSALAFTPDGTLITAGYIAPPGESPRPAIGFWDTATGTLRHHAEGHTDRILSLSLTTNGRLLASCSRDRSVRVWSLPQDDGPAQSVLTLSDLSTMVRDVSLRPDGQTLIGGMLRSVNATTNFDELRRWQLPEGAETERRTTDMSGSLISVNYSPDGSLIAGTNGSIVVLWSEVTGKELVRLPGHTRAIINAAFSNNGRFLATCGSDYEARLWDLAPLSWGEEVKPMAVLQGHSRGVTAVAFSPDGTRLATACEDATIKIWDVYSGREALTLTGHTDGVTGVAFSPDGRMLASSSNDGTVRLWETIP